MGDDEGQTATVGPRGARAEAAQERGRTVDTVNDRQRALSATNAAEALS
jgi:hypothetical protein